jgi:hypothetical protein
LSGVGELSLKPAPVAIFQQAIYVPLSPNRKFQMILDRYKKGWIEEGNIMKAGL